MALLVYAVTLVVAVLVSGLALRTVLSAAVIFLVVGFVTGPGVLGLVPVKAGDALIVKLVELALFTSLFTDGMRAPVRKLKAAWALPSRALLFGMPITLVAIALLGHLLVDLSWLDALLVGAVLSPTDPVFASAIVGREDVPARLRSLLNVESGLNDGLALPIVVGLLFALQGQSAHLLSLLGGIALGVAIGIALPWLVCRLERVDLLTISPEFQPLNAFATGLLIYALASLLHANLFLAAFAGGITVASVSPQMRKTFDDLGKSLDELLKLAAVLAFGALVSPRLIAQIPPLGFVFAGLTLVLVRPLGLAVALYRSSLNWREWLAAAWFGPKGFSSVVYGLYVLLAGLPESQRLYHLIALVIAASIVAHSSTDVVVVRWFVEPRARRPEAVGGEGGPRAA